MELFSLMDKQVQNENTLHKKRDLFNLGCGKTFTMMGEPSDDEMKGIIPRTF